MLCSPPLAGDERTKTTHFCSVMSTLLAFKTSEIAKVVSSLAPEAVDVLMMYIYRGMADVASANPAYFTKAVRTDYYTIFYDV